jgi:hypothetical protein
MSFWLREIAGWLLLAFGLWLIWKCYDWMTMGLIIQSGTLSIVAIIVFRGGLHLLKVAVAARICREARDRAVAQKPAPKPAPAPAKPVTPIAARGS